MGWEYKIETVALALEDSRPGSVSGTLNEWGSEGWELAAFVPNAWGKDQTWPALIFKRPKSN
jgi:uncharacterized protein DUF4177